MMIDEIGLLKIVAIWRANIVMPKYAVTAVTSNAKAMYV